MRLALKLISFLALGVTVLLLIGGYLAIERERNLFMSEIAHDANMFGQAVKGSIVDVWRTSGESRALELIDNLNRERHFLQMRWVWLDADTTSPFAPRAPRGQLAPAAGGHTVSLMGSDPQGTEILLTYIPVEVSPARMGALEISESFSAMSYYIHATIVRTLVLTGAMILLSALLVAVLGYRMVGLKLDRLAQRARAIGSGDFDSRIHLRGHDELTELADTMNLMCGQLLESQERARAETAARISALVQLRHADRLRTVGRLASGLAHELGTPLNVVSGRAGMIEAGTVSQAEVVESAGIIRCQVERMATLIRQLLSFSRKGTEEREVTDIRNLIQQTLDLIVPLSQKRDVTPQFFPGEGSFRALVSPSQIQQVLINLVTNALQAVRPDGVVKIRITRCERPDLENNSDVNAYLRIDIEDDGSGISQEDLPHIFEPFFTTKDVGDGTGLGLSIAYGIIREHRGWIEVVSEVGQGSRFSVYIPEEVTE